MSKIGIVGTGFDPKQIQDLDGTRQAIALLLKLFGLIEKRWSVH